MKKILLISTGGTFNKYYHPIHGKLHIDKKSLAIEELSKKSLFHFDCMNIIGKDSLDIDKNDRALLLETIKESKTDDIIVIHGTDTMDVSAEFVASHHLKKRVVFTGSMVPYSIDPVEATANLFLAYGFLQSGKKSGVYMAMNGVVGSHREIHKDRREGKFVERARS